MSTSRVSLLVLILALNVATACDQSPISRLDPSGTSWTLTELAGAELPVEPVVIEFDEVGGYKIIGPCQIVSGERWIDTDGHGFGFFDPVMQPRDCDPPGVDSVAVEALLGVERWEVIDQTTLKMTGVRTVELSRAP